MKKSYRTAAMLLTTIALAAGASLGGPASFALVAGGNKISALSKSPNLAADWLAANHCDTIRSTVTDEALMWLALLSPLLAFFCVSPLVFTSSYAYRRCVKKWPQFEGAASEGSSNNFFKRCYHKLLPNTEALIVFGSFLLFTAGLTIVMIELITENMKSGLEEGFDAINYACSDDTLKAPVSVNQIIVGMAGPVSKAARLAAYLPTVFFLLGSSLLVLGSATLIGFWRNRASGAEATPLVPGDARVNYSSTL